MNPDKTFFTLKPSYQTAQKSQTAQTALKSKTALNHKSQTALELKSQTAPKFPYLVVSRCDRIWSSWRWTEHQLWGS